MRTPDAIEDAGATGEPGKLDDPGKEMKARMRTDLRAALKHRRTDEARVVRALVAAIDNAEAPPLPAAKTASVPHRFESGAAEVERLRLSRSRLRQLLLAEIEEREQAAAELERLNKTGRAKALRDEALVARRYLD